MRKVLLLITATALALLSQIKEGSTIRLIWPHTVIVDESPAFDGVIEPWCSAVVKRGLIVGKQCLDTVVSGTAVTLPPVPSVTCDSTLSNPPMTVCQKVGDK